jgi:2-oxoglutarate dehydrogenase E2 component (dihydrolipoamide succinyltransferase)
MLVDIIMPKMGESITEGTILEWKKQVGDSIAKDETLLEISTDKVDSEIPSPATGTIVEIIAQLNDTVPVGEVIARIGEEGEQAEVIPEQEVDTPEEVEPGPRTEPALELKEDQEESAPTTPAPPQQDERVQSKKRFYSPLVKSIAKMEGITQEELDSLHFSDGFYQR